MSRPDRNGAADPSCDRAQEFLRCPDLFITIKETAYMLRVHPATARWLAQRGDLESFKTGRPVWIYRPSIMAYLRRLNSDQFGGSIRASAPLTKSQRK